MSQVLYRKWRPRSFGDVVGQPNTTLTLRRAVESGRLSHAYLFCGPRGTGKTSTARILAKAMNCPSPRDGEPDNACAICSSIDEGRAMDLVEIDAASNRGIDDIRELRDRVQYTPAEARFKVYIVDEAHMLTEQAFNALLKTLEEPPSHVAFVLATTESHKIPPTIASRCQRFDFRRITRRDISGRLAEIATAEGIEVESAALDLLSRTAAGGLRDAVNLLEQAIVSYDPPVTEQNVRDMLDMGGDEASMLLASQILNGQTSEALRTVNEAAAQGTDLRQLQRGLTDQLRWVMLLANGAEVETGFGEEDLARLRGLASSCDKTEVVRSLSRISAADLRTDPSSTLPLELAIVEVSLPPPAPTVSPPRERRATEPSPKPSRPARRAPEPASGAPPPTAPSTPHPAPPTPVAEADLPADPVGRLEAQWGALTQSLRHVKGVRFNLRALLSTCSERRVDGEVITLSFPHPSHAERMQFELDAPESRKIIAEAFERVMGSRYDVRVDQSDPTGPGSRPFRPRDSHLVRAAQGLGGELVRDSVISRSESEIHP